MSPFTVALFGEAEKGEYTTPYFCETLPQLVDYFGNPPPESHGLFFAVQALLYHRNILFFRVREEGFSMADYFRGLKLLSKLENLPKIDAISLPGVGDADIIDAVVPVCLIYKSILITTESDLFDYLMQISAN